MVRYHSNNTPKKADEATLRDVIMGRGKRVSEWPGNVFFRQVVNAHRAAYTDAHRSDKISVAMTVIKKIEQNKGRFMTENPDGSWVEIDYERAVEKCCQALREKEKPNPPTGNPFSPEALKKISPIASAASVSDAGSVATATKKRKTSAVTRVEPKKIVKKATAAPVAPPVRRPVVARKMQRKPAAETESSDDYEDEEITKGSYSGSDSSSDNDSKSSGNTRGSDSDSDMEGAKKKKKQKDASSSSLLESSFHRARHSNTSDMLKKLQSFLQKHGHCAVPPEWNADPLLADWCTIHRQLYRSIETEYTVATPEQQDLIQSLEKLDFCWDYDEWHWQHIFNKLVKSQQDATENESEMVDPLCVAWLEDQRSQQLENKSSVFSAHRDQLQQAGISLT